MCDVNLSTAMWTLAWRHFDFATADRTKVTYTGPDGSFKQAADFASGKPCRVVFLELGFASDFASPNHLQHLAG